MQVTRKIAAAAAVATVATLGLATVVSANVLDDTQKKAQDTGLADTASLASKAYGGNHGWYGVKKDGGLLAIDDNNVGPFQACHLFGSGTGIGGNVPADDITGVVGFFNNGNSVTAVKTCEQGNAQANRKWYKMGDDGVVSVSRNNVGPFQACHNFVPVNGVGGNVPVTDIVGIVGLFNDGNSATAVKTCEQDSKQANGSKWYRVGDDGLVSVSRNNVGPFQVCHNEVPVNGVGGNVPISDLSGILGIGNDGNSTDLLKTCEQDSSQNN